MCVAGPGGKSGAHPGSQYLLTIIGLQHHFAFQHIDELVLARMRMPVGGLPSRNDPGQVDAEIMQPRVIAEPPVVARRIRGAVRFRIAREVGFAHHGRIEGRESWICNLGHLRSLLTMRVDFIDCSVRHWSPATASAIDR